VTYTGLQGEPIAATSTGIVSWTSVYDNLGREIKRQYLGHDDKPIQALGYEAGWTAKYDAHGRQIEISYFDTGGNPVLTNWDGKSFTGTWFSRRVQVRDARGLVWAVEYYGTGGQRITTQGGWWRATYDYDSRGNQIRARYYDDRGNRTICKGEDGGYHEKETRYAPSNVVENLYYDTEHRLVRVSPAHARITQTYNAFGEMTAWGRYDADGRQAVGGDGVHRLEITRDKRGRIVKEVRYGASSAEALGSVEYDYHDEAAVRPEEERHLGARGKLVASRDQPCAISQYRWKGDDLQQRTCLGVNREFASGLSITGDGGFDCARIVYTWERPGLEDSRTCYGIDAGPANIPGLGYARVRYWHDTLGRLQGVSYLDALNHYVLPNQ
jgi:YD repeat-containing protein